MPLSPVPGAAAGMFRGALAGRPPASGPPLAVTLPGVLGGLVLAALLFLSVCLVCVVILVLLQAVLPGGRDPDDEAVVDPVELDGPGHAEESAPAGPEGADLAGPRAAELPPP